MVFCLLFPSMVFCFLFCLLKIILFEINGEELILCETYCIAWNREYGE